MSKAYKPKGKIGKEKSSVRSEERDKFVFNELEINLELAELT